MRQYLVEGATGAFPFIVDRSKPLVIESKPGAGSLTRIPGRFSVCDCVNGNNRRYRRNVWEKNLTEGSILKESIKRNAAFGLLEHPKDGIVTLLSPISHHVTSANMVECKGADGNQVYEVVGEITLLDTVEGNKLKALIEGGYNPLVSSRGYGSLQKASDGVDEVCEDYVCESWDVVIKPSFENAELTPNREPLSGTNAHMAAQPESQASAPAQTALAENKNLKESTPSTGVTSPPAAASVPQTKSYSMELNEIKGRISTLESLEPSKLAPARFAESLTHIEELHQEVAQFAAADPKRSWDGQKLHRQLDSVASRFNESAQAPVKQAKKLHENNIKLMKVINAVAQTALTYKKKLGESLKGGTTSQQLKEELTRRGQGWKRVAEDRGQKLTVLEKDFNDSCEALDMMSKRYHEDTTELARRLIVLEFKERAATPEIQKSLKEATRLRHIATIREALEGKKTPPVTEEEAGKKASGVGKPTDGENPTMAKKGDGKKGEKGECCGDEPDKVTNESKASGSAPVTESKDKQPVTEGTGAKLVYSTRDPRSINESVDLVKRLSTAAK
jgi:hypothetical protein